MNVKINYVEVDEEREEINAISKKMMDTYGAMIKEANEISSAWVGEASSSYIRSINKLMNNFIPAEREVLLSSVFLQVISEGYQSIENEKSKEMFSIIGMYDRRN